MLTVVKVSLKILKLNKVSGSEKWSEEGQLVKHLLDGYDHRVRPTRSSHVATIVELQFSLAKVESLV